MSEESDEALAKPRHSRKGVKVALVAGALGAGAIAASAIGASATTGSASTTTPGSYNAPANSGGTSAPGKAAPPNGKTGGSAPVRSDEKALSATLTAKLKAAALKAVPGGTVYRVESDAGDGVYEAHMTKADGTQVTVKFDKNLAVTKIESGMGTGDPAPAGGKGQPGNGKPSGESGG
jgi:uncharacterized membrane protein YkoI